MKNVTIKTIKKIENNSKRYDIEVENNHNFFASSILVHNSSFTEYFRKNEDTFYTGICSRSMEKKIEQSYVSEYVKDGNHYHKYIKPDTKEKGWFCNELNDFKTDFEVKDYETINIEVKDSWVDLAHSSGLFEKGMEYCKKYDIQLAFRGEIYGQGLKGSGNKLNPDATAKQGLILFGIDSLESGFSIRQNYSDEHNLMKVCEELGLQYTKPILISPKTYDELIEMAENVFKQEEAKGRIIEGIVVRTMDTNDLSCKVMNSYYDSKK